jgi:hypothetical protein
MGACEDFIFVDGEEEIMKNHNNFKTYLPNNYFLTIFQSQK